MAIYCYVALFSGVTRKRFRIEVRDPDLRKIALANQEKKIVSTIRNKLNNTAAKLKPPKTDKGADKSHRSEEEKAAAEKSNRSEEEKARANKSDRLEEEKTGADKSNRSEEELEEIDSHQEE